MLGVTIRFDTYDNADDNLVGSSTFVRVDIIFFCEVNVKGKRAPVLSGVLGGLLSVLYA